MGSTELHEKLVNEILATFGSNNGIRIWKNNTGMAFQRGRPIKFGLKGSSDIIGILSDGTFLAIECKTGKARQSQHQKNFQKMIEQFGGIYILARSLNDVERGLAHSRPQN
jgi:hypothetical protein